MNIKISTKEVETKKEDTLGGFFGKVEDDVCFVSLNVLSGDDVGRGADIVLDLIGVRDVFTLSADNLGLRAIKRVSVPVQDPLRFPSKEELLLLGDEAMLGMLGNCCDFDFFILKVDLSDYRISENEGLVIDLYVEKIEFSGYGDLDELRRCLVSIIDGSIGIS